MSKVNVVLLGLGHVGKAFLRLCQEKEDYCRDTYGLELVIKAVFNSKGAFIFLAAPEEKDIQEILSQGQQGSASYSWEPKIDLDAVLCTTEPGVLVECTPSDGETGEPGLTHIQKALDNGWHVATANKGPLVVGYRSLNEMAQKKNVELKISGATAAALPTLDIALYSFAGAEIQRMEGILNGTTNDILTQMREGKSFRTALTEAQARGIAEADPSKDVEGWDTAYKLLLLTNAIFDRDFNLADVNVEGIGTVSSALIKAMKQEEKALKLLGIMKREGGDVLLEVGVHAIDKSHPLFGVDGSNKGITFHTDTMGMITVHGGRSDPRGAAAALLKDIINIYRE
jgi:homoserine dehydrogenase